MKAIAIRCRSCDRSGLTLFEVLLSLAIFATAMAAIGQLISNGVRGSVESQLQTEAVIRCQTLLADMLISGESITAGQGQFQDDSSWTWESEVSTTDVTGLDLVSLTVTHPADDNIGQVSFTLTRFHRDPLAIDDSEETP